MSEAPLVPAEVDLREYSYMPLDVVRLRDSDLAALSTGDEFRAAVMLWCASWHQTPAASLPSDDRLLARLAGYGRDLQSWRDVKEGALRGFIECTDGRLYHPVIADKAIEAWEKRKSDSKRTAKATEARIRKANAERERDAERDDNRDDDVTTDVTSTKGKENKGKENKGEESKTPQRPPEGADLSDAFDRFWATYPKRGDANPRKPAFDKFRAACKRGVDPETIIAGAQAYAHQCQALGKTGTSTVAQAVTWLNQERWADDHTIPHGQGPPNGRGHGRPQGGMMDAVSEMLNDGDDRQRESEDQGDWGAVRPRCLPAPGAGGH